MQARARKYFQRLPRSMVVVFLGAAFLAVWVGCSTPEERYKVLSFFFDGVPDPSLLVYDEEAAAAGRVYKRIEGVNYFIHEPYKNGACQECHTSFQNVYESAIDSRICIKCHEPVTREYPRMHGPVAAVACLFCHDAHDSPFPDLIKTHKPDLCTQCHEPGVLLTPDPPAHLDPERNCLDCHSGHGGNEYGFLKAPEDRVGDESGSDTDATSSAADTGDAAEGA